MFYVFSNNTYLSTSYRRHSSPYYRKLQRLFIHPGLAYLHFKAYRRIYCCPSFPENRFGTVKKGVYCFRNNSKQVSLSAIILSIICIPYEMLKLFVCNYSVVLTIFPGFLNIAAFHVLGSFPSCHTLIPSLKLWSLRCASIRYTSMIHSW